MLCLLGNHRHRLDARRAGADHGDALAGEIDRLMRPVAGVIDLALEAIDALDVGMRASERQPVAITRSSPSSSRLLRSSPSSRYRRSSNRALDDRGVELDVRPQVEAIGDVLA